MKAWFTLLLVLGVCLPHTVKAQQEGKVWRVGYLSSATPGSDKSWVAGLQQGLRELGYVEGQSIVIDQRHAAGKPERLLELAEELVRLKVDVIVTYGTFATQSASKTTSMIPIVMSPVNDPVGLGLVASLARPGGNVTGLTDSHTELITKRLELLKEIAPTASRIAVLLNPAHPMSPPQLKDLQSAAPGLGLTIFSVDYRQPEDIERAFATMTSQRADALLVIPDGAVFLSHRRRMAELAVKSRLPAVTTVRQWVEDGGLASYGTDFPDLFRRAAGYVDRILKGAKPADLPIQQPTKFELVINVKTAKALGLTIPASLLLRADHVIQ